MCVLHLSDISNNFAELECSPAVCVDGRHDRLTFLLCALDAELAQQTCKFLMGKMRERVCVYVCMCELDLGLFVDA